MILQLERKDPYVKVFIARNSSRKIVGWCTAEHFADPHFAGGVSRYYDVDLFVDPGYRRKGVGRQLLTYAEGKLRRYKRFLEVPNEFERG